MAQAAEDIKYKQVATVFGMTGNVIQEIARLFPDSALFGSIVLYLITQHLPYGIFAVFLLESSGLYRAMNLILDSVTDRPAIKRDTAEEKQRFKSCRSGFLAPRLEPERLFMHEGTLSMPMFYISAITAYLLSSTFQYASVLNTMGASWASRTIVSAIFGILILTLCYIRNIGCTTHLSLIGALLIGLGGGVFFWFINSRVFGVESTNFGGLPYLVNKADNGTVLYTCVPSDIGA
jgi:hypothetical protein